MVRRGDAAPAGSRWGRLTDQRAAELLRSSHGNRTLIVDATGGFPYGASDRPGTTVLSALGASCKCEVRGVPTEIPFSSDTFTSVIDTTRPEQPSDHERRVRELIRVCSPEGTVALVTCGGTTASGDNVAPRSFTGVEECFRQAGWRIDRAVTFDLLSPLSPWRLMLGERRAEVLRELEEHLRFPRVRRAVRLLERHLVAEVSPHQGGRVFVVARRCNQEHMPGPFVQERPRPSLRSVVDKVDFGAAVLRFLQDDAVVCWAAFLDGEILSALPFDLASYLEEMGSRPESSAAAARALLRRGRWRYCGLEVQALLSAVTYRAAKRTIRALSRAPDSVRDGVFLPATLEYELFGALNRQIERSLVAR